MIDTRDLRLLFKGKRLLRQSNVRVIVPRSYSSSGPLEARASIRVHDQPEWRLEVLAPARRSRSPLTARVSVGPLLMWLGHVVPGSFRRGPQPADPVGLAAGGAV